MKQIIVEEDNNINASFQNETSFNAKMGVDRIIETGDYEKLYNQPYMNDRKIIGRKTSADYGLQDKMDEITPQDIDNLFYGR